LVLACRALAFWIDPVAQFSKTSADSQHRIATM
jgi:hypothetical protein